MKIAVIVPSWFEDKDKIPFLFDSIEKQTRKPDLVLLCISSIPTEMQLSFPGYSFPIQIEKSEKQQSAAENRNRGIFITKDTFDILSFFDSDDLMHPQRLECIERGFLDTTYSGLVHNYLADTIENHKEWIIYPSQFEITRKNDSKYSANGHISIRSSVAEFALFPVDKNTIGKEDSLFIEIMEEQGLEIGMIELQLSFYRQYPYKEKKQRENQLFLMQGGRF